MRTKKPVLRKRRKAAIKSLLVTRQKTVFSRSGDKLKLHIQERKFPRSISVREGYTDNKVASIFNKKIRPEFERFYRFTAKNKKKYGNKYIFRITTSQNAKGARIKGGFTIRRREITSKKGFEKAMRLWLNGTKKGFLKRLKVYLTRGLNSFTITGVSMEVSNEISIKTVKPKRGARPKAVRGRRH